MNHQCPSCGKEFSVERKEEAAFRPFCSKRCKLVDLGRWLDGTYNITEPLPEAQPHNNSLEIAPEDET